MKAVWIACLLLIAPVWLGCAHETTVTTTTSSCVEPEPDPDSNYSTSSNHSDSHSDAHSDPHYRHEVDNLACEKIVEEVIVTTERDRCHGVLSCTFTIVGEVISLPFRIVGAAFDVIL